MKKNKNQLKLKLICKTNSDNFYYIDDGFIQYVLSIPIKPIDSYRLNIDFKCKDKNNHQELIGRLNDLNTKYPSPDANIMLSLLLSNEKTTNLNKEDYSVLADHLNSAINNSYRIISLKINFNNLKNNIRLLNSPEIDENFLDWLERFLPSRFKKKGGSIETMYIESLKGERNNIEFNDKFKNWIKHELPNNIKENEFMDWLNKEFPSLPKTNINSIDNIIKMYKNQKDEQNNELINTVLANKKIKKVTNKNGQEYIYDDSTVLINRTNQTLKEQVKETINKNTTDNPKEVVKQLSETREEISVSHVVNDGYANEDKKNQANHLVASKIENENNTQLLGNNKQGIYIDNRTGNIIENDVLEKENGKLTVKSNELNTETNKEISATSVNEPTPSTEIKETNLIEKERLEEIRRNILLKQEEDWKKEKENENEIHLTRKKNLKPNPRTGYINYYFLITITIICILVLMLIK